MYIRVLAIALACIAAILPATGKVNVNFNEYKLAEVTGNNINIRTGPGTNFPKAYTVYTDWDGNKGKTEVAPAYKGERYFVKDAGDWWEIDTRSVVNGDSPRFISKKFAHIIETEPFDIGSIDKPLVYAYAEKQIMDIGDPELATTIVTIYPNGIAVTQNYSPYENSISIGAIGKDNSCILNEMATWLTYNDENVSADTPIKISVMTDINPPCVNWEYGKNAKRSFVMNGEKIEYVDISTIPAEQWITIANKLIESEEYRSIRKHRSEPDAYMLRDDLNKFVDITNTDGVK